MVTDRRAFLRTLTRTAAGLLVAPDALELLAPARRYWPGWTAPRTLPYLGGGRGPIKLVGLDQNTVYFISREGLFRASLGPPDEWDAMSIPTWRPWTQL